MNLSILNPKLLDRQLKLIEARVETLQSELRKLTQVREACLLLLGSDAAPSEPTPSLKKARPSVTEGEAKPPKRERAEARPVGREELPGRIRTLLEAKPQGLSADEIYDELKARGAIRGRHPVASVYSTLESHPDLFRQNDNGNWSPAG